MNALAERYEKHHATRRPASFTVLSGMREGEIARAVGTGKTVLDIGCRDGSLTKSFIEGNVVTGIEIDPVAAAKARADLGITVHECDLHGNWEPIGSTMYDVVVAGEVLEHLFYPGDIIARVRSHIHSEKGVFVVTIPNAFSLKNRVRLLLGKKKGTSLEDPTHINHFTVEEMRQLLLRHFSQVEVVGLGRYARCARLFPQWCAFDLMFVATA